jgi:CubicO group peptidase (beta-lactamase class C family)
MLRRGALAWTCATIVVSAAACQTSSPAPVTNGAAAVDHYLAAQFNKQQFSGTVLIAEHGKVLLAKSYGWADEESRLPNRLTTQFGIGSITKQFIAMAILLLQDQGKLRVGDPICHYINGCPAAWNSITLRNLLTHTSGIPDYATSVAADKPLASESLLAFIERQPLDFPPGAQFRYSNSGYAILALVVEDVTRAPYSEFLQREIFGPLHLTNTGDLQSSPSVPNMAVGYDQAWTRAAPSPASPLFGAGSMYSTVEDLYRWDSALFGHTFATSKVIDPMFQPQVTACNSAGILCDPAECATQDSSCFSYGYGWFLQQLPVKDGYIHAIWHTGLVPGFAALNYHYPAPDLTVVLLCNLSNCSSSSQAVVNIVDLAFF